MKVQSAYAYTKLRLNFITNKGVDFNCDTNDYTCPVTGFYMFTVTSFANIGQEREEVEAMMTYRGNEQSMASAMA